ncbi:hypothetical protein E3N88_36016 [Mikania micrantha]|uniref:Reverse transcriptase Ty1/copia-type domain-containing protein n=1 Tax=Mikania micrantha TaxID=192012 RepID=A0A5N6M3K2_9ASTR|nr:hypothetical protein E3N88_36016 [Mikania micrantha]
MLQGSPLIFNPSDPHESEDKTYDHTPLQGWKRLDEVYELLLSEREPTDFKSAAGQKEWDQAMTSEINSIERNKSWRLTELPEGQRPIGLKPKGRSFVTQPEGLVKAGKEHRGAWNMKLDGVLKEYGFKRCKLEQAVYIKHAHKELLIVGIYVDDLIVTGSSREEINHFKAQMERKFEMCDLGLLSYYLGLEVKQGRDGILTSQKGYAEKILLQSGMSQCNPVKYPMEAGLKLTKEDGSGDVNETEYRSVIGCLRYLTHTRPDLMYSVGYMSRYMQSPKTSHSQAVKHILRYIRGTTDLGIQYNRNGSTSLVGYSDSSFLVDPDDGKGTYGIVFYYNNGPIIWNSQKQATVALSSYEAEFTVATSAACQAIWLRGLLAEITGRNEEQVLIKVDNKSAISLMKNHVFHGRSKHVNTRFHYIRECVEKEQIKVEHVSGEQQRADILTKPLPRQKFAEMRDLLGVVKVEDSKT